MQRYKVILSGKEIDIFKDIDGKFIIPDSLRKSTALKPAIEEWWLFRKPLSEKTVAENVLRYGTGGLNIDGCRVEGNKGVPASISQKKSDNHGWTTGGDMRKKSVQNGRFPSHLILDGSEEVRACFPETVSVKAFRGNGSSMGFGGGKGSKTISDGHNDKGSASRYFKTCPLDEDDYEAQRLIYMAKASKRDRNEGCEGIDKKQTWASQDIRESNSFDVFESDGRKKTLNNNNHPTVKSTSLMQYFCKLITPPGGIILDPFIGSGSTGKGGVKEGFVVWGIDNEAEYLEISDSRIKYVLNEVKKKTWF